MARRNTTTRWNMHPWKICLEWFTQHFLLRKPPGKVLLLLDSHTSDSTNIDAGRNEIIFCLSSPYTHYLQPSDREFLTASKNTIIKCADECCWCLCWSIQTRRSMGRSVTGNNVTPNTAFLLQKTTEHVHQIEEKNLRKIYARSSVSSNRDWPPKKHPETRFLTTCMFWNKSRSTFTLWKTQVSWAINCIWESSSQDFSCAQQSSAMHEKSESYFGRKLIFTGVHWEKKTGVSKEEKNAKVNQKARESDKLQILRL